MKRLPTAPALVSLFILHFSFFILNFSFAQQDPLYASYMMNPLAINPAYAGSNNMLNGSLQYRTQWAGLDANPTTVNFSAHMSAFRNQVGAGLMVIQDKL
ncbi:MAG: type IX secretion system membrane protein PorP/SprF, partial [Cyclobacteriaceae bacterium]|nr:type IX secretion system membrane protein PorP/SprF [Cyclobacteriaceae bacterium]